MIVHFGSIWLVKCFSNQVINEEFTGVGEEYRTYLNMDNLSIFKDKVSHIPSIHPSSYESLANNNFQSGHSSFVPPNFSNLNNSHAYMPEYYTNPIQICNGYYSNAKNQFHTQIPDYTTYQQPNNFFSFQNYSANNEENMSIERNEQSKEFEAYTSTFTDKSQGFNFTSKESYVFIENSKTNISHNGAENKRNSNFISSRLANLSQACDNNINLSEVNDKSSKGGVYNQIENRSSEVLDRAKNIRKLIWRLNKLESCKKRFSNLKIADKVIHSMLCSNLERLKKITEHTIEICTKRFEKEESNTNPNNYSDEDEDHSKLAYKVQNLIFYFEKFIKHKEFTSDIDNFNIKNKMLKNIMEKIEIDLKSFEPLESNKLKGNTTSVKQVENRIIRILIHNKNSQYFDIPLQKEFHPVFLTMFEECMYLCIYRSSQYLRILKVNVETQQYQNFDEYKVDEGDQIKYAKIWICFKTNYNQE